MLTMLKQLKCYWIYNLMIALLLAVKYILPDGNEVFLWQWTFLIYIPILFLPFVSGPILGHYISKKHKISKLHSLKMSIIILITTFLTMCIPNIALFIRDGLFDAQYGIVDEAFYFPACLIAASFEITCLIKMHRLKDASGESGGHRKWILLSVSAFTTARAHARTLEQAAYSNGIHRGSTVSGASPCLSGKNYTVGNETVSYE